MKKLILAALLIGAGSLFIYRLNLPEKPEADGKPAAAVDDSVPDLTCPTCNLIVIALTNTRKDHLGTYGYERDTSPNIDAFFKNSLIFENAFAPSNWTFVNAISFFTSWQPYRHRIMQRSQTYDPVAVSYLPEILKKNGYATAGFASGEDYDSRYTVSRGFDLYVDQANFLDYGIRYRPGKFNVRANDLVDPAIRWLSEHRGEKFFLYVQAFDAHCPYYPNDPFRKKFSGDYSGNLNFDQCYMSMEKETPIYKDGEKFVPVSSWSNGLSLSNKTLFGEKDLRQLVSLYDGEIAEADFSLGKLFNALNDFGLDKNSVVVFMSEHGEMLGEHGLVNKAMPVGGFYDEALNFPLLFRHPKIDRPVTINALAQTVDLLPSLLAILGIHDPDGSARDGKNLVHALGRNEEMNEYVYAGSERTLAIDGRTGIFIAESVRNKEWKLVKEKILEEDAKTVRSLAYELYDVKNDPAALTNLFDAQNDVARRLQERLEEWVRSLR